MKRRSLTPTQCAPPSVAAFGRRASARRPFTERVVFRRGEREVHGFALNISLGGLRAILDESVGLGECFEVGLGDEGSRSGRVVWIQEELGGAIVGLAFLDAQATREPERPLDVSPRSCEPWARSK
ncbi:PilZ domain-containing protein [Polyangium sp. y55x31]|uniref:PilZ domain-containing protein n=1 Tax=Polyangium sp. y55x31 TaxID=3042688 RepID=UPI0024828286|nr:PilZ domain-containing protein [Polyangium sp. y55x31]MDI1475527.1 PilZ domain-containing protein [Polyangium sp. y55x31]